MAEPMNICSNDALHCMPPGKVYELQRAKLLLIASVQLACCCRMRASQLLAAEAINDAQHSNLNTATSSLGSASSLTSLQDKI